MAANDSPQMESAENVFHTNPSLGITNTSAAEEAELAELFLNGGSPTSSSEDITPKENESGVFNPSENEEADEESVMSFLSGKKKPETESKEEGKNKEEESPTLEELAPEEELQEEPTSVFSELQKELTSLGIFTTEEGVQDEEITTPEQFKERWEKEGNKKAMQSIYDFLGDKWGDEGIAVFEAIFQHGVAPRTFLAKYDTFQSFRDMDMTQESNQEQVVREYYKRQNWPQDKIDNKVQKLKDYADLEEESQIAHEKILENEDNAMQQMIAQEKQKTKAKEQYQQQYGTNLTQILNKGIKDKQIKGFPITDKVARETYDYLFTPKYTLGQEDLTEFDKDILELRKPENHELKVLMSLILRNKGDLSKVKVQGVTEETNKIFNSLVRTTNKQKPKVDPIKSSNTSFFSGLG